MSTIFAILGRICLGALFVVSGIAKLTAPAATAAAIEGSTGLSGGLAIPTGIFELVAGLLLMVGLMSRLVAIALAVFTALTVIFFHSEVTDPNVAMEALKNLSIIGGLLMVFAYGQMRWNYEHLRIVHRGEEAAHRADGRAHAAELAAAKAEGRAEARAEVNATGRPVSARATIDTDGDGIPDTTTRRGGWWRY